MSIMVAMNEIEILKIVEEDILRILTEEGKATPDALKGWIKVSYSFVSKAIQKLEDENLIRKEFSFYELTETGKEKGESILKKHLILENYFKKIRSGKEAHKEADLLEHYISGEVLNNIKELSTFKKESVSLIKLELHEDRLITDILIPGNELFERIISMGIVPGERIKMLNKIPGGMIVKIENKKFAIDKQIAEKIMVLDYEKA
ncbi:MAG: iron dependent repressor, metal binding and dimerization domain protein [Campylobacterota bacterium]|nr:iron dependent repressor, metal binding and dimerization domain protein [Campylobacterota bacterium]